MTEEYTRRDHLAKERTYLANERTFLAYLRTSLAFLLAGAAMIKFFPDFFLTVPALILIIWGGILLAVGIFQFFYYKKRITRK